MACEIKITSVNPYGMLGQGVSSVAVKGTAVDCQAAVVTISCGAAEKTQSVQVSPQGSWEANFTDMSGTNCICDDPNVALRVTAFCKADPNCLDNETLIPIPCNPYPCPEIDHIEMELPDCNQALQENGWNVRFKAVINGSGVTNYVWSFGDGQSMSGADLQTVTHKYACAGDYLVTLVILSDCEPGYAHVLTMQIVLPPCGCPQVNSITATADQNDPCTLDFHAKIAGPFQDCIEQYLWDFGDGSPPEYATENASHTYANNGTYTVRLTLLGGIGELDGSPCSSTTQVTVSNCSDGGGNGGGENDCPWWNPKCWNWCAILLAYALFNIAGAAALIIAGACSGNPVLLIAGLAAAAWGLVLLGLWYKLCSKFQANFCDVLNSLIQIFKYIVAAQAIVVAILGALGLLGGGCGVGVLIAWGYYGTVLSYLLLIKDWSNCS